MIPMDTLAPESLNQNQANIVLITYRMKCAPSCQSYLKYQCTSYNTHLIIQ